MNHSVDKDVIIRLKWGQEYHGKLISVDSYMNIQMRGADEWIDGKSTGNLGEVLIRYVVFGSEAFIVLDRLYGLAATRKRCIQTQSSTMRNEKSCRTMLTEHL